MSEDRRWCIGIDGGGTGSRAGLVCDGTVVSSAEGGPVQVATMTEDAITDALDALVGRLDPPAPSLLVGAICIGAAGATGPRRLVLEQWCRARFPNAAVDVARDIDLVTHGVPRPTVALVVGTGVMAVGIDVDDRRVTVDGLGFLLGDGGGGFWIGREALHRALAARDRAEDHDRLLDPLLDALGLDSPTGLATLVRGGTVPVAAIAALAPIVCRLAADAVPAAVDVVADAAHLLGETLACAIDRLGVPPTSICISGSIAQDPVVRAALVATLASSAPTASVAWTLDGLSGALARAGAVAG